MAQRNPPNRPVKSVNNVFEIIEYLRETDGATLPEIADHVNLAKSTAHGYLKTLEYRKNIICDDEEYKLSLRFSDWGEYVKNQHPMSGVADDEMEMIAEQTGESVWLFVEECGQAVRLLRVEGDYSVTTMGRVGRSTPLHLIAAGKAILAHLPKEKVNRLLQSDLKSLTQNTITDPEQLREELAEIREANVAFNDEEAVLGERAVACPIVVEGMVRGSICVSGPTNRLQGEKFRRELPDILKGSTNAIELSLKYP